MKIAVLLQVEELAHQQSDNELRAKVARPAEVVALQLRARARLRLCVDGELRLLLRRECVNCSLATSLIRVDGERPLGRESAGSARACTAWRSVLADTAGLLG